MEDRLREILELLDRKLHPRQRVGLRFYLWQVANAVRMFFSFWRYCYGCDAFKTCRCEPDDFMAKSNIDARTAASLALITWKPVWDGRPHVAKPTPLRIVPQSEFKALAQQLQELHRNAETIPWKVEVGKEFSGSNWLLGSFGIDGDDDHHVFLTTDRVHASECSGEGATADATLCAEVRNLLPQIVAALRWRAAVETTIPNVGAATTSGEVA